MNESENNDLNKFDNKYWISFINTKIEKCERWIMFSFSKLGTVILFTGILLWKSFQEDYSTINNINEFSLIFYYSAIFSVILMSGAKTIEIISYRYHNIQQDYTHIYGAPFIFIIAVIAFIGQTHPLIDYEHNHIVVLWGVSLTLVRLGIEIYNTFIHDFQIHDELTSIQEELILGKIKSENHFIKRYIEVMIHEENTGNKPNDFSEQ